MAGTDFVTESQVDSLTTNIATAVKANTTAIGTKTDDTTVNNHISDATAAHAASAVSVADVGTLYAAGDVEAALAEVMGAANLNASAISGKTDDTTVNNHISDATAAHAASAISYAGGTGMSATNVEAAIDELANEKLDNTGDTMNGNLTVTGDVNVIRGAGLYGGVYLDGGWGSHVIFMDNTNGEQAYLHYDAAAGTFDLRDPSFNNMLSFNLATKAATFSGATSGIKAADISILDAALDYTATDVEAALAEVKLIADAAAGGGVAINDAATNTSDAWSSQKISDSIATAVSDLIGGAPGALDTLNELAAAINDDATFTTTVTTALGLRLRFDAAQSLTGPQKAQGQANLGVVTSAVDFAAAFNAAIA